MLIKSAISLFLVNGIIFMILGMHFNPSVAISFLFCASLLTVNFVGLALMWWYTISYQKAGLPTLIAIIKYPLIGFSIYWAGKKPWINEVGIIIGVCSFPIIIVVTLLIITIRKRKFLH